jgi:hypothetical protein
MPMLYKIEGISSDENCLRLLKNYIPCAFVNFLSANKIMANNIYPKVACES